MSADPGAIGSVVCTDEFVRVAVNDCSLATWDTEHGLSLLIDWNGCRFLFDTGMGDALVPNLVRFGIDFRRIEFLVLSHGHNDHTGGLVPLFSELPAPIPIYAAPRVTCRRWSFSSPVTPESLEGAESPVAHSEPREISMPRHSADLLNRLGEVGHFHQIDSFRQVRPGIFLTGPIPRHSGESTGGAFFLDPEGHTPDEIIDEQAILLSDGQEGVLIHGCCHSGIVNTLEHCKKQLSEIPVRTVIGGLHLVHADGKRLRHTADYLEASSVKRLVLLHCTGQIGVEYLRSRLGSEVIETPCAGETIVWRKQR